MTIALERKGFHELIDHEMSTYCRHIQLWVMQDILIK